MKKIWSVLSIALIHFIIPAIHAQPAVNPNASEATQTVLHFLHSIQGKGVLSGQENLATDVTKWTELVYTKTGEYPAIIGEDWSYGEQAYQKRYNIVEAVSEYWKNGGLVTISWHQVNPDTWDGSVNEGPFADCQQAMTQERFNELLDENTSLHKKFIAHIDTIAGYLKMLEQKGVVVLWRPYHEMNGGWFWWGAKNNFKQLWKIMFERYTNHHQLNNLIWVWSPNISFGKDNMQLAEFYPGNAYVDIIGIDGYNDKSNWDTSTNDKNDLNTISSLAQKSPIAITELGTLPDIEWLKTERPKISWFLCWWTHIEEHTNKQLNDVYRHRYTLNRGDIPFFDTSAPRILSKKNIVHSALNNAVAHYSNAIEQYNDYTAYPDMTNSDGSLKTAKASSWVSGFFPGCLWYLFDYSNDFNFKTAAQNWTNGLKSQQYNNHTHDLGFMMYCSFGNGFKMTNDAEYKQVLLTTAQTLSSRHNENVKCIRSWDWGSWSYPVIIDNMMNLELLTWAAHESNQPELEQIAKEHALTTIQNHFRDDYSSYHVVDYNPETGEVIKKETFQGFADHSSWARGQAWGLYGYTMMYRETEDVRFLNQAINIAEYIIGELPGDYIPYWDFHAPDIPDAPRDASAAAITASALIELSQFTDTKSRYFLYVAEKIIENLASPKYTAPPDTNANFILKHSTSFKPAERGVDVPIIYADYYYIEALMRYEKLGTTMTNFIDDKNMKEDSDTTFNILLTDYFEPQNGKPLQFEIHSSSQDVVPSITPENKIHVEAKNNFNGTVVIGILENSGEFSINSEFRITVLAKNDKPVPQALINPPDEVKLQSTRTSFRWEQAIDIDQDQLTYQLCIKGNNLDSVFAPQTDFSYRIDLNNMVEPNTTYQWYVLVSDGKESIKSDTYTFTTPEALSLTDNIQKQIRVYPNPFTDYIVFSTKGTNFEILHISVFDISGKKITEITPFTSTRNSNKCIIWKPVSKGNCQKQYLYQMVIKNSDKHIYITNGLLLHE